MNVVALFAELLTHIFTVVVGASVSHKLSAVGNLLQFTPADMSAEVAYNRREAALPPHCCVCSLFASVINQSLASRASESGLII